MSWQDIIKAKELTPKQKKLDKNHNGVIDAQDFHIMNDSEKKAEVKCPDCSEMFSSKKEHALHHEKEHTSKKRSAFTAD